MARRNVFIPVELQRVTEDLEALAREGGEDVATVRSVFTLYVGRLRQHLAEQLTRLKACYAPYDPDAETVPSRAAPPRSESSLEEVVAGLRRMLERANFSELAEADVHQALHKRSPRGLQVHVDLEEFDVLGFWARGSDERVDARRRWSSPWREERVATPIYRRLCVLVKLADEPGSRPEESVYRATRDDDELRGDCLYVKLFRDVAYSDLEMVLPNTRVRMTGLDKVKLGMTGGGGTVGGLAATFTKIGAAANPMTWGIALAGLAGVLWRQLSKLFHQRVRYMAALTGKLYCRNLDNNFGAITRLVELAEEEDCKEALLAWFFLSRAGALGLGLEELDARVEAHLRDTYGVELDFEVRDAVDKLKDAGVLFDGGSSTLVPLPPEEVRARLLEAWAEQSRRWSGSEAGDAAVAGGAT